MTAATAALVQPDVAYRDSLLAALREFQAEGDYADVDVDALGEPRIFADYLALLATQADPATPRTSTVVPQTMLWWTRGSEYLGRITIRHCLNDNLRHLGGHIGYNIRPSARRQGHATAMLRAGLTAAHDMGIDPVLITCDATNTASRRVIEANGGELIQPEDAEILRFWVKTSRGGSR